MPDGKKISYVEFLGCAAQLAHALADLGATIGHRIVVQVEKSSDVLALYAGCVQAGMIFLPLNPAYTATEVAYFTGNSGAPVLVAKPAMQTALAPIATACDATLVTMGDNATGSLCARTHGCDTIFKTVPRRDDDLAAILYTSGTTGRSKGALLSQRNLMSNAKGLTDLCRFTPDDVLIHALPVFHTHGLFVATNVTLLAGSSILFMPRFDAAAVLGSMTQATAIMGVPTFYTRLLDAPRFTHEVAANMRLFILGSAPLLAETHRAFTERTGHKILERYGMTETNMSTSNPYVGDRRAGTVGPPLPGVEARVCDAAGAEIARGEVGTIEVRG